MVSMVLVALGRAGSVADRVASFLNGTVRINPGVLKETCKDPRRKRLDLPTAAGLSEAETARIQELSDALDRDYPNDGPSRLNDPARKSWRSSRRSYQRAQPR
jgi:hypothetical protein